MGLIGSLSSRDRDARLLEHNSARKLFVSLLLLVFLFGANAVLTAYYAIKLHRFEWSAGIVVIVLAILVFRLARTVCRQMAP